LNPFWVIESVFNLVSLFSCPGSLAQKWPTYVEVTLNTIEIQTRF